MERQEPRSTVKVYTSIEEMKGDEHPYTASTPQEKAFVESYYDALVEMRRKGLKRSKRKT